MTFPPGFVKSLGIKKMDPPWCRECFHFSQEKGTAKSICWKYGAYVLLYSSCSDFSRRRGSDTPIKGESEIKEKFRFGLNDITRDL